MREVDLRINKSGVLDFHFPVWGMVNAQEFVHRDETRIFHVSLNLFQ